MLSTGPDGSAKKSFPLSSTTMKAGKSRTSIRQTVFRTIYSCKNAELQTQARLLGHVEALDDKEVELAAAYNLRPGPQERAWDYWAKRLRDAEARVAPIAATRAKPASASVGKPAKKALKPVAKAKRRKR